MRIGPAAAVDSYLRVDRIVAAAIAAGAEAIHPGYGFLSENAALAGRAPLPASCSSARRGEAIEAMGDKIRAKATVAARRCAGRARQRAVPA